jgi:hypothetical protein
LLIRTGALAANASATSRTLCRSAAGAAQGLAVPAGRQSRLFNRDLEEALADRLSFRQFSWLDLEEAVPDATALSRFRIDPAKAGLAEAVLDTRTGNSSSAAW